MKQFLLIPIILSTFILGFLVNSAFSYSNSIKELPFNSLFSKNYEKESPSDFIKEEDIQVFPDKIIILVNNAKISSFEDTNSMDPLLDINDPQKIMCSNIKSKLVGVIY